MIDMGKPEVERIFQLPHVVKFNFERTGPKNVSAQLTRKGQPGCVRRLTLLSESDKCIQVELGTDMAKLGHGQYNVQLIQGCEVCAEACIFLDYSCAEFTTEHVTPRKFKESKHCG